MSPAIPHCPDPIPQELNQPLHDLAAVWAKSVHYPRPAPHIVAGWDAFLEEWAQNKELPLFIRKKQRDYSRREIVTHESGRMLIPMDNSPAQWSFARALLDSVPALTEVYGLIADKVIPVAMVMGWIERERATLQGLRGSVPNPNAHG